ncbi:MAG TPA: hypothetical protein VHO07_10585 [Streptosporangiaceae bacterium]|nr:hypothetical protein [Streptosporangiaceae bacterium]
MRGLVQRQVVTTLGRAAASRFNERPEVSHPAGPAASGGRASGTSTDD